ncbi:MAG TPA: hypothetical protein VGE34_04470 [Candidatus Saccharimonadales bacterium]
MEQVDQLTATNVKSGPLKALFHRMLHRGNLDDELKPGFKNDAIVTPEKIAFTQKVFDTNEAYFRQQFSDQPSKLRKNLHRIAAAADLLRGDDPEEIAKRYLLSESITNKAVSRDLILAFGSEAAKLYSWIEREKRYGDGALVEHAQEAAEEGDAIQDIVLEQHETVVRLPGFESLHNTVLDLHQDKKLNGDGGYAGGLLVLFERATPKSSVDIKNLLEGVRRTLRSHVDLSPELNQQRKDGSVDVDLQRGTAFIRKMVQQRPRAMSQPVQYNTMAVLDAEALIMEEGLAKEDARAFVESRIAYALHTLYMSR